MKALQNLRAKVVCFLNGAPAPTEAQRAWADMMRQRKTHALHIAWPDRQRPEVRQEAPKRIW